MKLKYILYTILLVISYQSLHSQTLDDAKSWYLEGRYAEALPVFRMEYQQDPKNASLNQWLGVSLYKTGRLTEAEQYLKYASERKIPEAYISLGELYAKLYRFEEAEKEFEKYQRANRRNDEALKKLEVVREYADKLSRYVNRTEDVQIIDSLVVPKAEFLSAYNLSKSSGSLMMVSDFFAGQQNGGKTLYMNQREEKIYYSKGGNAANSNLFTMEKLLETFGNEKQLPESINDSGDQDFPFVMSDGMTIYFASTGHQSYGGYDIFVTRYNLSSESYLTPNQLSMPFNSPFNDYLLVIDEEKGLGWFASDRYQPADSVCVYTYIPNERVTLLESDDMAYMARRAAISSIADSWKPDVDYSSLRAAAKETHVSTERRIGDFEFVINDRVTYHNLSDFKSSRAQSIFSQALGLKNQLKEINAELDSKREQFSNNSSSGNNLTASILNLEKQAETLYKEIERLEIQARNDEIRNSFN
ncbi:MAG: tetratricopeptide repeat protein [Fermentimonas sp.]|nr:tetratricopeptide repeat protein [Fermentimonas sp.]